MEIGERPIVGLTLVEAERALLMRLQESRNIEAKIRSCKIERLTDDQVHTLAFEMLTVNENVMDLVGHINTLIAGRHG